MGCFLGCFGLSSKGKRILPRDQIHCSYQPLHPSTLYIPRDPKHSDLKILNKPVKKKVSFNLQVETYNPIPEEEEEEHEEEKESNKVKQPSGSYPSSHRYHNCIDIDEVEDEDEDSDVDTEEEPAAQEEAEYGDEEWIKEQGLATEKKRMSQSVMRPVENLAQWKARRAKEISL